MTITILPGDMIDDFENQYHICGSIVSHDAHTGTLNLVHQSAKDYLVSPQCPQQWRVDRREAAVVIMNVCWQYCSLSTFQGIDVCQGTRNSSERSRQNFPFLGFAIREVRTIPQTQDHMSLVTDFLKQCGQLQHHGSAQGRWLTAFVHCSTPYQEGVKTILELSPLRQPAFFRSSGRARLYAAQHGLTCALSALMSREALEYDIEGAAQLAEIGIKTGNKNLINLFVNIGFDINLETPYRMAPLFFALHDGHEDMAFFLISIGADPRGIPHSQSDLSAILSETPPRIVKLD